MKKLNKKGFTLVELLAVMVVLALLMVVAGGSIGKALDNSKKTALKTETAITKYKIAPFFSDKRKELVQKVVLIKQKKDSSLDANELTEKLCEAIKLQKQFISLTPEFIIEFVDYYCSNIGNISNSDSTVFSKVFEANLTAILSPYQTGILTTDKIYRLISMVAHYIHFNKKYPISEAEILSIMKIMMMRYLLPRSFALFNRAKF